MKKNLLALLVLLISAVSGALVCPPLEARLHKSDKSEDDVDTQVAGQAQVQDSGNKILAETVQTVNSIQVDLQAMKGALEENRHFFQEQSDNNEKILKDFDLRLTGMEERLSLFESQLQDLMSHGGKGGTAASGDEAELYRKALSEVNAQNFKAAVPIFDQFLKKYPKSSMADNAQYWKGEALYGLKQFPEAVLEFQKVVKRYPKSDKVPAAVLKQGYCFFETKSYLDAKAFLQKVVTDFPKSEEATKAREKIQQIDGILATPAAPARPRSPAAPAPDPANL
jgi:tol-pal system protein YbgF